MSVHNAPVLAMRNKQALTTTAGCYYCLKIFDSKEIKEYTDQGETALCPYCSVDAVIPQSNILTITEDYLKSARAFWIG